MKSFKSFIKEAEAPYVTTNKFASAKFYSQACTACKGRGWSADGHSACPDCKGSGKVPKKLDEARDPKEELLRVERQKTSLKRQLADAQASLVRSKKALELFTKGPNNNEDNWEHLRDLHDDVKNDEWIIDDIQDWIEENNIEIEELEWQVSLPGHYAEHEKYQELLKRKADLKRLKKRK